MTAKVTLNPYSNRWNSQQCWPEVESALKAAKVDFDIAVSEKKGQITNARAGLDPYVTIKHEKIHFKGMVRYLVAALQGIMDKPEWQGSVKWDDGDYHGKFFFISVGNGRRTGGFFMTPHADPFDRKLTVAFGYRATRLGLLRALPCALNEDKGS